MQVISSGKNTQLHAFPGLTTEFTYPHVKDARLDFQFMPERKLFLAINPSFGFELLRKVQKTGVDQIQRIKKLLYNDLKCGACSGKQRNEIALGTQNGTIHFYNVKKGEVESNSFKSDSNRHSVLQMNYSANDDMLSAIFDNHEINIFGLTTSVKMDQFQLDSNSIVARFNPSKRFHMAVGSYLSNVTVLDVQTKKALFKQSKAHKDSPCPDLCWSPTDPHQLISVGYDCTLNVYDIRQKLLVHQIKHSSPFSSVAISECGLFCCSGSLSGDLCSYDLRSIRASLATRKGVHSGTVTRVGFVTADTSSTIGDIGGATEVGRTSSAGSGTANLLGGRRSLHSSMPKKSLAPSRQTMVCRESIDLRNRPSMMAVTGSGHDDGQSSFNGFLNKCTRMPDTQKTSRDSLMDMEVRPVRFADISDCSVNMGMASPDMMPNRRSSLHYRRVQAIQEDDNASFDATPELQFTGKPSTVDNIIPDPKHTQRVMSSTIDESSSMFEEMCKENLASPTALMSGEMMSTKKSMNPTQRRLEKPLVGPDANRLAERLTAIETVNEERWNEMMQRLDAIEEKMLQRMQEFDIYIRFQLWNMEDTDLAMLRNGLMDVKETVDQLARSDPFIAQFSELKRENAQLRAQVRMHAMPAEDQAK